MAPDIKDNEIAHSKPNPESPRVAPVRRFSPAPTPAGKHQCIGQSESHLSLYQSERVERVAFWWFFGVRGSRALPFVLTTDTYWHPKSGTLCRAWSWCRWYTSQRTFACSSVRNCGKNGPINAVLAVSNHPMLRLLDFLSSSSCSPSCNSLLEDLAHLKLDQKEASI